MFDELVQEFNHKAKAYIAAAFLAVVTAISQAPELSQVDNLDPSAWLKALGVAAAGGLAVYLKANKPKDTAY